MDPAVMGGGGDVKHGTRQQIDFSTILILHDSMARDGNSGMRRVAKCSPDKGALWTDHFQPG